MVQELASAPLMLWFLRQRNAEVRLLSPASEGDERGKQLDAHMQSDLVNLILEAPVHYLSASRPRRSRGSPSSQARKRYRSSPFSTPLERLGMPCFQKPLEAWEKCTRSYLANLSPPRPYTIRLRDSAVSTQCSRAEGPQVHEYIALFRTSCFGFSCATCLRK